MRLRYRDHAHKTRNEIKFHFKSEYMLAQVRSGIRRKLHVHVYNNIDFKRIRFTRSFFPSNYTYINNRNVSKILLLDRSADFQSKNCLKCEFYFHGKCKNENSHLCDIKI